MREIFKKLEIPYDAEVCVVQPPENFTAKDIDFFNGDEGSQYDAVGVYIDDPALFAEQLAEGERLVKKEGQLWAVTPLAGKESFSDDFIEQQSQPLGLKSTACVPLDDVWEAHRMEMR